MNGYKGGLKWYWKQRPYQRVDGSFSGTRRRHNKAELGNGRRRFWRFRITPRLRLLRRLASPKRILRRIRDAYVNMMLSLTESTMFAGGYGYAGEGIAGFGRPQLKEYDERKLVEIYKTILAQGQLFAATDSGGAVAIPRVVIRQDSIKGREGEEIKASTHHHWIALSFQARREKGEEREKRRERERRKIERLTKIGEESEKPVTRFSDDLELLV